jgi:MFS family permease
MNRSIPLVLAVALFMEQMDSTVIATSLPAIAADIGTNPIALKLALTAYLVSLAIFIPISGWMADRFGAKRIFCLAIGVFMVGSLGCAMAGPLAEFVGARVVQGVGGSMMTPVARLILVRAARKDELVSAMALLTIPALVGPMVGPPVGGFITTFFSWHWIFLINVPIGIIGIWLASRILPKMPGGGAAPVDLVGFILSGFAAAGIVFGLSVISLPALLQWWASRPRLPGSAPRSSTCATRAVAPIRSSTCACFVSAPSGPPSRADRCFASEPAPSRSCCRSTSNSPSA